MIQKYTEIQDICELCCEWLVRGKKKRLGKARNVALGPILSFWGSFSRKCFVAGTRHWFPDPFLSLPLILCSSSSPSLYVLPFSSSFTTSSSTPSLLPQWKVQGDSIGGSRFTGNQVLHFYEPALLQPNNHHRQNQPNNMVITSIIITIIIIFKCHHFIIMTLYHGVNEHFKGWKGKRHELQLLPQWLATNAVSPLALVF